MKGFSRENRVRELCLTFKRKTQCHNPTMKYPSNLDTLFYEGNVPSFKIFHEIYSYNPNRGIHICIIPSVIKSSL